MIETHFVIETGKNVIIERFNNLPFLIAFDVLLLSRPDMIRINRGYNDENSTKQKSDLHAVLVVGYDDRTQLFLVRNSWGPSWVSS
jgi:C1A family cysteine protease